MGHSLSNTIFLGPLSVPLNESILYNKAKKHFEYNTKNPYKGNLRKVLLTFKIKTNV